MSEFVYIGGFLDSVELQATVEIVPDHYSAVCVFFGNSDTTGRCP
jgi:hypothetical protein